ncbi:glycosyltransferase family 2 protein [Porphyrobacter sp. GA68]|uniref:glycosyltransferase n=1 Tax=Porphyrobacter sp. GA68 TaxID=2883480 RepID=UPI001D181D42|nr:glycosyltransferase family 2 protein [Porphyrobacter sp. GA68]
MQPQLSVIVPTFNEVQNIGELYGRISKVLHDIAWEMVVVDDDSSDGTADAALALARAGEPVRVIRRIGRRGLSSAVIEGMLSSAADFFAVIDADLQHDEALLPQMLETLRQGDTDIVIGTRYAGAGSVGDWSAARVRMSRLATVLAQKVTGARISDPMSGFFAIRREPLERTVRHLSGEGYKILLDIFASSPVPLRHAELPYTFRQRLHGESKLDAAVLSQYGLLLFDKTVGRFIPPRLIFFSIVGAIGVFVHYAAFALLFFAGGVSFLVAQTGATITAMTGNYVLNNQLTYRDARRKGWKFVTGLLAFYLVCSIGLLGNVGIASYAFSLEYQWWLAAFAGIVVGTVWNFAASSIFVWKQRRL